MANLLSSSEIDNITGAFGDVFDTFRKDIVVYKEPKKTVSDVNLNFLYGYGSPSQKTNYTYTPVSGVYPALVSRKRSTKANTDIENISYPRNRIMIKVESEARNFIKDGKTEKIAIDDKSYNIADGDIQVNFLSKIYYVFELEDAK
jgi:hypothetical protein